MIIKMNQIKVRVRTMRKALNILLIVAMSMMFASCHYFHPSRMLRVPSNFEYDKFNYREAERDYALAVNDRVVIRVYPQDGERLITNTDASVNFNNNNMQYGSGYVVEYDSTLRLPVIGRVPVVGMTIRDLEAFLEKEYSKYVNNPYVMVNVANKRVIVFPGDGSSAQILTLTNNSTNLLEALAMVGGIHDGKAYNIKLIRGDLKSPQVYKIDLSTLEGMKEADLALQANDIIYVEPFYNYFKRFTSEISMYLAVISSITLIVSLVH